MNAKLTVLEYELKAVRALRVAPDTAVVREALNREEELQAEVNRLREESREPLFEDHRRTGT